MILSPVQIAATRDLALHNFLGFSTACLDAGQRISELMVNTTRETFQPGDEGAQSAYSLACAPGAAQWIDGARTSRFLEQIYEIAGDAHKAAITATQAQMRAFDEAILAGIAQTRRFSPWEAELALNAMRVTVESAEHSMEDVSDAAIDTVNLLEKEVRQLSESLTDSAPKGKSKNANR